MADDRFTITLASVEDIERTLRVATSDLGELSHEVGRIPNWGSERGWSREASQARQALAAAHRTLTSTGNAIANLRSQVSDRRARLQQYLNLPLPGPYNPSYDIYMRTFSNPNPYRWPRQQQRDDFWDHVADFAFGDLYGAATGKDYLTGADLSTGQRLGHLALGIVGVVPVGKGFKLGAGALKHGDEIFAIAKAGGMHWGHLRRIASHTAPELRSAIKSHEKVVEEHVWKLANPQEALHKAKLADPTRKEWHEMNARQQQGVLKKWEEHLTNAHEQAELERKVLRELEEGQ